MVVGEVNYIFVFFPISLIYQIDCCIAQTVELKGPTIVGLKTILKLVHKHEL